MSWASETGVMAEWMKMEATKHWLHKTQAVKMSAILQILSRGTNSIIQMDLHLMKRAM